MLHISLIKLTTRLRLTLKQSSFSAPSQISSPTLKRCMLKSLQITKTVNVLKSGLNNTQPIVRVHVGVAIKLGMEQAIQAALVIHGLHQLVKHGTLQKDLHTCSVTWKMKLTMQMILLIRFSQTGHLYNKQQRTSCALKIILQYSIQNTSPNSERNSLTCTQTYQHQSRYSINL